MAFTANSENFGQYTANGWYLSIVVTKKSFFYVWLFFTPNSNKKQKQLI